MPVNKPYRKEHAEALLLPCDEDGRWKIDEDERGVWPAVVDYKKSKALGLIPEYEVLTWKPVMALQDDQNAPDCKDTPALPFPFDAKDLAAFMLAGVGAFVADYYGNWEGGPDGDALASIDPANNYARRAVREAFDAYREAVKSVGELDYDDAARARALVRQYGEASKRANEREGVFELGITDDEVKARSARATASVADLKAEAMRVQAEVTAKMDAWRDAMARELLAPKVAPEPAAVEASPAQPQAATPAPVVANSAIKAPPMTRRDLLTPAIEAAQKECENPFDAPAVWDVLSKMAQIQRHRLLGASEDGIKWIDANDDPQFFKLKDLRDRLRRKKQKAL